MSRYVVRMKPMGSFFFGDERTFNFKEDMSGDTKNDKKLKFNIVKSRLLPQQTSILGMLRKEVLVNTGLIKNDWKYSEDDKQLMGKLIGAKASILVKSRNLDV